MKKAIFKLFFSVILLFVLISEQQLPKVQAQTAQNIIFHYHRYDNDYTNWDLWVWQNLPVGKEGKAFPFTATDEFGKVASINLSAITGYTSTNPPTRIGFIVKKGNWLDREGGGDRFISVSNADELGNIHVYLIQGDPKVYLNRNEADISPKILHSVFKDFKTITFTTTSPGVFDLTKVKVYQKDTQVNIASISTVSNTSGSIILPENIDLTSDYFVSIEGFANLKYVEKTKLYDTTEFKQNYTYLGDDLGASYTKDYSEFRVWAPTASTVSLVLYTSGDYRNGSITDATQPTDLKAIYPMNKSENGTWYIKVNEDLNKIYYTYKVTIGDMVNEAVDPYAEAVGINGHRGMVENLAQTNPTKWTNNKPTLNNFEDSIIYEIHIRDLSIHSSSNIQNKGKYLGLTEQNTTYEGVATGLNHLVDLGITHLHILPAFDFRSIDEINPGNAFNWGYDPLNFNTPEGTYSTNAYLGEVRINEFKQMVQALHDAGIRVVMDVVYNHLGDAGTSSFQKIVPNYYFRVNEYGQFTNGSGVGNETASERAMMRKFIVDSVKYWAQEYHIDGFRFDLMAVHDIETMNLVRSELDKIDNSIIVYGEGWTGGTSALPVERQATKEKVGLMPRIAVFNDVTRDGVKGSVWADTDKGFVQNSGRIGDVMFGIVGGITHPQTRTGWANDPEQIVNYVEAHDNQTLWDKLTLSQPNLDKQTKIAQHKLAGAIVLTSQGIPFLHAGQDFLRSKPYQGSFSHNSYNLPDYVNQIRYDYKKENIDVYNYYKGLIALRKAHSAFRMTSADDIRSKLSFLDTSSLQNVIAYRIHNAPNDSWQDIYVAFNGSNKKQVVSLPKGNSYNIVVDKNKAGIEPLRTVTDGQISIEPYEAIVAYVDNGDLLKNDSYLLIIISSIVGIGIIGSIIGITLKRKK